MTELTVFTKSGGPLTKRISLMPDGSLKSDGSACVMAHGRARRANIASVLDLGALIEQLKPNEAIALGRLRPDLPDRVEVVTKRKLNGAANVIARTGADLVYCKAQTALALLDYDTKGMPGVVGAALQRCGGYWAALVAVLPALSASPRILPSAKLSYAFSLANGRPALILSIAGPAAAFGRKVSILRYLDYGLRLAKSRMSGQISGRSSPRTQPPTIQKRIEWFPKIPCRPNGRPSRWAQLYRRSSCFAQLCGARIILLTHSNRRRRSAA